MKDRRALQDELNRINQLYQQYDLELRKRGGSDAERQQMRDMLNAKKQQVISEMGDDLQKLDIGESVKIKNATISGPDLDQTTLPDAAKQKNLGKVGMFKNIGKKVAGIVPFAGAGMAALSGDPAMAAEELAGDVPFVGQAYEAVKPETAGNREEEKMMLAERRARQKYKYSPAAMDKIRTTEDDADTQEILNARQEALRRLRGE